RARENRNLCRVLESLKPIKRLPKVRAVSYGTVIGHQQGVVMLDQRTHRVSQLFSRRCAVFGQRHTTKRQDYFRKNRLIDWQARNRERRPMRRMSVTDGPDVRPFAIN